MIKELIHHGVRTFCIAPGSRSTPLIVAAANHPLAETITHYDERGLGFHALGLSKGSKHLVALIVTSGSAVGNLFPAVMEGYHDHIPLVLLTADRPPELRDTGASQTTDQVKLFEAFTRYSFDLPCPDPKIPQAIVGRMIARGMSHALFEPRGPVHFNCMYRKPLVEEGKRESLSDHQSQIVTHAETALTMGKPTLSQKDYEKIADELTIYEKGVILVSGSHSIEDSEKLYSLARILQWPIFADVLSNIRSGGKGYATIPYYDLILKTIGANENYTPDAILQIGDRFISQRLMDWISSKSPKVYCHISSHPVCTDAIHAITRRVTTDLKVFLDQFPSYLSDHSPSSWLEGWKKLSELTEKGVSSFFKEHNKVSEPHLFHTLKKVDGASFFFGNSMSIRNGDIFFFPNEKGGQVYGNRALSGIDGNIATAAGIAKSLGKPLIACIGDLAFLHDLNSLSFLKKCCVKLIVINNNGGDIFTFLPIHKRKEVFKTYFTTPHNLSFEEAAKLFDLEYENPFTVSDLEKSLKIPGSAIIEVKTKGGHNKKIHQMLVTTLKKIITQMEALV
jgi:2-succinyl-5-enolpyruvyl-6-hydroxy-3-cyclohexene-1-carboxylate synthase